MAIIFHHHVRGGWPAPPLSRRSAVFTLTPLMAAGYGWLILRQTTGLWVFSALLIGAIWRGLGYSFAPIWPP